MTVAARDELDQQLRYLGCYGGHLLGAVGSGDPADQLSGIDRLTMGESGLSDDTNQPAGFGNRYMADTALHHQMQYIRANICWHQRNWIGSHD